MMKQTTFSKIDTLVAGLVFVLSAIVYGLTVEPTASLWDCPEFILGGYKLEIGHPPGAPVFMLAANLFSQLAADPSEVAHMVNLLSALLSAGCIFFLFLSITHLTRRLIAPQGGLMTLAQVISIEACGLVGALVYTFSDTFWFSAVEAEVYAFSSFLTALLFWLILKWESEADDTRSDRWIVLIAYITGLSIGVHLLCLLCLPAMSFVVYYRKTKQVTWLGSLKTLLTGALLVALILYGIIPGVIWLGSRAELLFTNQLGCPYHTGLLVSLILLAALLMAGIWKARSRVLKTLLTSLLMILVGYSSYGVILIRANANTPMSENAPGNIFSLGSYVSREQYGDTPLLYGPAYSSELDYEPKGDYLVAKEKKGSPVYRPVADSTKAQYELVRHNTDYVYKDNMFFPRMHSRRHAQAYENLMGGVQKDGNLPTFTENLRFFLTYQVNFMYWRYFLWNFVGRQNNIQGFGEVEHGNWITGFRWIDDLLLGFDTSKLPSDLKNNKGRNVFYGLPLLLGLLGLGWQLRRGREGKQQALIITLLFLMTGLAIVVYLNQTPLQPRERDYAYVGSFYAFAMWVGMGTAAVIALLKRCCRKLTAATLGGVLCLLVPLQMVSQTWDDHDRSGRYACRDFGANYLQSLQQEGNPIILTDGDNDTFPLWYNHEVEGVRTDTRDCNLEYLQTDWYIDQMKRPAYLSPALPISWKHADYKEGIREYVSIRPEMKRTVEELVAKYPDEAQKLLGSQPFELRNIMQNWVLSSDPDMQCIPTDTVTITSPQGTLTLSFKGKRALYKNELMVLEMLSHADWSRPIYTSISLGPDQLSFLHDHLVLEGLAYRISPEVTSRQVDVDRLYDNIMHRFRWGGMSTPGIYLDEDVKHMANTLQYLLSILIDSLLQDDLQRALQVCAKWEKEMPQENLPYTDHALSMARCYYLDGQTEKADGIVKGLLERSAEWLAWADTIQPSRLPGSLRSVQEWLDVMRQALSIANQLSREEIINPYYNLYENYLKKYTAD